MSELRLGYQDDASPIEYFREAVNVDRTYQNDMPGALTVLSALQKKPLGDLPKQVGDIILHADDSVQYLLSLYIQARILNTQKPEVPLSSDEREMNKFASFLYKDITTLLHGTNGHRTWNDELDCRPVLSEKMREGIATLDDSWQKIRKEFRGFEQMLRSKYPYVNSFDAFF